MPTGRLCFVLGIRVIPGRQLPLGVDRGRGRCWARCGSVTGTGQHLATCAEGDLHPLPRWHSHNNAMAKGRVRDHVTHSVGVLGAVRPRVARGVAECCVNVNLGWLRSRRSLSLPPGHAHPQCALFVTAQTFDFGWLAIHERDHHVPVHRGARRAVGFDFFADPHVVTSSWGSSHREPSRKSNTRCQLTTILGKHSTAESVAKGAVQIPRVSRGPETRPNAAWQRHRCRVLVGRP